jgi:ABC-2 type transport system ATP-binding protein
LNELLRIESVTKRIGKRRVLNDVSFSVYSNEILGLIGPNGAGKTTLFECIAGVMPVSEGTTRFKQKTLASTSRNSALFYVPEGIVPWADQRVKWVINFFGQLYRRSATEISTLVESLKLSSLLQSHIGSLSKGERKRVLLLLGLLTSQPLLLLDEPFDGLDLRQTREVMTLLKKHAQTRTLVLSIHQLLDAGRVCDRLVLLSDGKVVGEGTLPELRSQAKLAEGGVEEIFLALT